MDLPFEMKLTAPWSRMLRLTPIFTLAVAATAQARVSVFEALDSASGHPTGYAQCPQFFASGKPPTVAPRPKQRELCYSAFAILHSGETKTPVYVAQRLNRQSIEDADEKRATKFFADARLPRGERVELEDYKRSGYSRGHIAPAGVIPTPTPMAQSFSLANMVQQVILARGAGPRSSRTSGAKCFGPRGSCS